MPDILSESEIQSRLHTRWVGQKVVCLAEVDSTNIRARRLAEELGLPEEKSVLLQHMLLSHHGQPEFGAAVVPMCAEAELLSLIDTMDSRMEIYRETLEEVPEGAFSKRIFALDKKVYHHR